MAVGARDGLGAVDQAALGPACWIGLLGVVALAAPNTQTILAAARPTLDAGADVAPRRFAWRLSAGWAGAAGLVLAAALARIGQPSPFLYFQF